MGRVGGGVGSSGNDEAVLSVSTASRCDHNEGREAASFCSLRPPLPPPVPEVPFPLSLLRDRATPILILLHSKAHAVHTAVFQSSSFFLLRSREKKTDVAIVKRNLHRR